VKVPRPRPCRTLKRKMTKRLRWDPDEDEELRKVVEKVQRTNRPGVKRMKWAKVIGALPHRSAKQCRDRWKTISCNFTQARWTKEEDARLLELFQIFGARWTIIQRNIPNRTDNAIKARFRLLRQKPETSCVKMESAFMTRKLFEPYPLDSPASPDDLEGMTYWFVSDKPSTASPPFSEEADPENESHCNPYALKSEAPSYEFAIPSKFSE